MKCYHSAASLLFSEHGLIELFGAAWMDEEGMHLLLLRASGGVSSGSLSPRELGDLHPSACSLGKLWFGCEGLASSQLQSCGYRNFVLGTVG